MANRAPDAERVVEPAARPQRPLVSLSRPRLRIEHLREDLDQPITPVSGWRLRLGLGAIGRSEVESVGDRIRRDLLAEASCVGPRLLLLLTRALGLSLVLAQGLLGPHRLLALCVASDVRDLLGRCRLLAHRVVRSALGLLGRRWPLVHAPETMLLGLGLGFVDGLPGHALRRACDVVAQRGCVRGVRVGRGFAISRLSDGRVKSRARR